MRDDAPQSLPSEAQSEQKSPFDNDAGVFLWAEEVAREMAWVPEFDAATDVVRFFPRVAAKHESDPALRAESEIHVWFPYRERPFTARLEVPAGTLPLDFRNLRQKLYDPSGALEISTILEGLPASFRLGLPDALQAIERASDPDSLRALAQEAFERGLPLSLVWIADDVHDPSAVQAANSAYASEDAASVADALVALATVGELWAWSEENAYVNPHLPSAPERVEVKRAARKGKSESVRDSAETRRARAQAETAPPSSSASERAPMLPVHNAYPRPALRSSSSSSSPAEQPRELTVGARVQVAGGPFTGRIGVVQSLDKGQARVVFGLLTATIAIGDLIAARPKGGRPRLSSSHRRISSSGKE